MNDPNDNSMEPRATAAYASGKRDEGVASPKHSVCEWVFLSAKHPG